MAGHGLAPEATVVVLRFAFEELALHRIEVAIVPRNRASRRVVEKLELREEGVALRYLEIDGRWEDHVRYAITSEEWADRREELIRDLDQPGLSGPGGSPAVPERVYESPAMWTTADEWRKNCSMSCSYVYEAGGLPTLRRSRRARMKFSTAPAEV